MSDTSSADQAWVDRTWECADGLQLHYRDYAGAAESLPVVCMHGLTRNARDFSVLAERIAPLRRVIVPEMRGRGNSEYAKDSATYNPAQYAQDVEALLADLGINRFVAIGTSLGGIMTMLMAAAKPGRVAAAVLNDIGPVVEAEGIAAIQSYVGQGRSFATWMHAARALKDVHRGSHPTFGIEDWLDMAKRVMVLGQGGRIVFDYDMAIADPFKGSPDNAAPPAMWEAFEALGDISLLLVRGELSNLLSVQTAEQMQARLPSMQVVTIAKTGHAPLLTEPDSLTAIDRLLADAP